MDGKVLLEAVEALVKIKKVDRNMVFDALEMVLLTAYKKESGSNAKASVSLNRETGEYKIYEEKTVVDEIHEDSENAINEITATDPRQCARTSRLLCLLRLAVLLNGNKLQVPLLVEGSAYGPVVRHGHRFIADAVSRELPRLQIYCASLCRGSKSRCGKRNGK